MVRARVYCPPKRGKQDVVKCDVMYHYEIPGTSLRVTVLHFEELYGKDGKVKVTTFLITFGA